MKTLSKTQYFERYMKNHDVTSVTKFAYLGKEMLQMLLLLQLF
jgi:hypothetical protein